MLLLTAWGIRASKASGFGVFRVEGAWFQAFRVYKGLMFCAWFASINIAATTYQHAALRQKNPKPNFPRP